MSLWPQFFWPTLYTLQYKQRYLTPLDGGKLHDAHTINTATLFIQRNIYVLSGVEPVMMYNVSIVIMSGG